MRDTASWMRYRRVGLNRGRFSAKSSVLGSPGAGAVVHPVQTRRPYWGGNHYDLLHVSKDASSLEIRSAYLHLIKQYHPDREDHSNGAHGSAAEINAAYWVLRDPVRRARYDDSLQEEKPERAILRSKEAAPAVPPPRRRLGELLAAGGLLTLITALVMFGQYQVEQKQKAMATASVRSIPSSLRTEVRSWLPAEQKAVNDSSVVEAASAATSISSEDAIRHSKSCFAQVAASHDLKILDYCMAFDTSVALWDPATAAGGDKPGYFNWTIRQARHAEALFPFFMTEKEAEARRVAVEAAALAQLTEKLSQQAERAQSLPELAPTVGGPLEPPARVLPPRQ